MKYECQFPINNDGSFSDSDLHVIEMESGHGVEMAITRTTPLFDPSHVCPLPLELIVLLDDEAGQTLRLT